MTPEQKDTVLDEIVNDLIPLVKEIEKSPEICKYHYDRYLAFISTQKTEKMKVMMAALLVKAGANQQGVAHALNILI